MLLDIIYNLFITPLEYVFEVIFSRVYLWISNPAIAIIALSLAMNFLVLPLYKKADELQEQERDKVQSMKYWVDHIKRTFKGDERYMMLNTYYRQQNYKPIYALRSSLSLLLQIPFFIAAYHYLSNLHLLNGASFLFLKDLGSPDQLIKIGTFGINVLPIVMTLINVISGYIYLKGFTIRDKIQTYGIAAVFLVLLYNSPSGLVFYWTLNQIFSVLKNVFMKLIKNRTVLNIVLSVFGLIAALVIMIISELGMTKRLAAAVLVFILFNIPTIMMLIPKRFRLNREFKKPKYYIFIFGITALTVLMGILIPTSVLASSAAEFIGKLNSPGTLIIHCFSVSVGLFFVWFNVFYYLSNNKGKTISSYVVSILSLLCATDYLFFGKKLGNLSTLLIFDNLPSFSIKEKLLNLIVVILIIVITIILVKKAHNIIGYLLLALSIGIAAMSVINISKIGSQIREINTIVESNGNNEDSVGTRGESIFNFSRDGKNVVIVMVDRAVSGFLPYIFAEKPELEKSFSGFTYYPNALSYGTCTNFSTPSLFGGYDYTPLRINERDTELLEDKHNEALLVLPTLFSDNGYNVTVSDPPYAGYTWIPDLSIYDGLKNVKAYNLIGNIRTDDLVSQYSSNSSKIQKHNFFFYSIFKCVPVVGQTIVYNNGNYMSTIQKASASDEFLDAYAALCALPELSDVQNDDSNNLIVVQNDSTHYPSELSLPDYVPGIFDPNLESNFRSCSQDTLLLDDETKLKHYHINMATILKLAEWLDFMKSKGVYDNTRIIIVSDHAWYVNSFENLMFEDLNAEALNPLFIVKDFNSKGKLKYDNSFMTLADIPEIATRDIIDNAANPFTGRLFSNNDKSKEYQYVTNSSNFDTLVNNGTVFDTAGSDWWGVKENIFSRKNWINMGPILQ